MCMNSRLAQNFISGTFAFFLQVQMFGGSVDDRGHAVCKQLYLLPSQRQGGARRQRQNELCGARRRPPGAAERLQPGINSAG